MRAIPINSAAATVLGKAAILRNVTLATRASVALVSCTSSTSGKKKAARLMNGAGSWLRGELVILEQHAAGAFDCPGKI